jgi:hypothetical protein
VEYTQDGESTEYRIAEVEGCDFGRGFEVTKVSGEDCFQSYDVLLDGQDSQCECRGWLRWSHRGPCRHLWLVGELLRDGVIRPKPRPPLPFPQPPRPAASLEESDWAEDRQRRLADLSLDDL